MKTQAECFPCFFKQAILAARMAGIDEKLQKKVLTETAGILYTASLDRDPPYIATHIFHKVYEIMGTTDPYSHVKEEYNKIVAGKFEEINRLIQNAVDPLRMAVKLSLAGNIIDFGILETFDLDGVIQDTVAHEPVVDHYTQLKEYIEKSKKLLFIADNAGEIGFDRLLIDEIRKVNRNIFVTVAVKKVPIINDATVFDAEFFGLEIKNKVIDNGSKHIGTYLPSCSHEMIEAYNQADTIIAKGQANWESLEEKATDKIFFLLKAKCSCVARVLGVNVGDSLIKNGKK